MKIQGTTELRTTAANACALCLQLLKEQMVPLLVLFGIATSLSLSLEHVIQNLGRAEEDQRWILQLGLGLIDFVQGLLLILVLSWGIPKVRQFTAAHFCRHPFQTPYVGSFLAEYLRMLGQIILHTLLLVIPGLVRYGRLIFVPYVALFVEPYRADRVDAVKLSIELSRGRMAVILAVVVATMATQIGLELAPQGEMLHGLVPRLICEVISLTISVWSYSFIFLLFERALEDYDWRKLDGTHV